MYRNVRLLLLAIVLVASSFAHAMKRGAIGELTLPAQKVQAQESGKHFCIDIQPILSLLQTLKAPSLSNVQGEIALCSEEQEFKITRQAAELSGTIKALIEELGVSEPIVLNVLQRSTFSCIVECLREITALKTGLNYGEMLHKALSPYVKNTDIIQFFQAANYLDIPILFEYAKMLIVCYLYAERDAKKLDAFVQALCDPAAHSVKGSLCIPLDLQNEIGSALRKICLDLLAQHFGRQTQVKSKRKIKSIAPIFTWLSDEGHYWQIDGIVDDQPKVLENGSLASKKKRSLWKLPHHYLYPSANLSYFYLRMVHEKDINCFAVENNSLKPLKTISLDDTYDSEVKDCSSEGILIIHRWSTHEIQLIDMRTGDSIKTFKLPIFQNGVGTRKSECKFSPDGKKILAILANGIDSFIYWWHWPEQEVDSLLYCNKRCKGAVEAVFSGNSKYILVTSKQYDNLKVMMQCFLFDACRANRIDEHAMFYQYGGVEMSAVSNDGSAILFNHADGLQLVVNGRAYKIDLPVHPIGRGIFSSDDTCCYVTAMDGSISKFEFFYGLQDLPLSSLIALIKLTQGIKKEAFGEYLRRALDTVRAKGGFVAERLQALEEAVNFS